MTLGAITGSVVAGSGVALMARIRGNTGQLLTRASLSSIVWVVSDLTLRVQTASGVLDVEEVVFDCLVQDDLRWGRDSRSNPGPDGAWGYNFLAALPADALPATDLAEVAKAPHRYQADVTFTPVSGQPWKLAFSFVPTRVWG